MEVTSVINECHAYADSTIAINKFGSRIGKPLVPRIDLSTASQFNSLDDLDIARAHPYHHQRYSRDNNSLALQLEQYFNKFCPRYNSLLFASGMAAIANAILCLKNSGVQRVYTTSFLYRKTKLLLEMQVSQGLEWVSCDDEVQLLEQIIEDKEKSALWAEIPSNPFLGIVDVDRIKQLRPDITIVVDYSLAGLCNLSNNINADILVSSCTKYIGGHNDVLGGVAQFKDRDDYEFAWSLRSAYGSIIDAVSAYLIFRSLRTYDTRIRQNVENCNKVLEYLRECKSISQLYYPGMHANEKESRICAQYLTRHRGSVISLRLKEATTARNSISQMLYMKMAPSFGSVDTLFEFPYEMSYKSEKRKRYGMRVVDQNLLRLSIGIEPIDLIIADLMKLGI